MDLSFGIRHVTESRFGMIGQPMVQLTSKGRVKAIVPDPIQPERKFSLEEDLLLPDDAPCIFSVSKGSLYSFQKIIDTGFPAKYFAFSFFQSRASATRGWRIGYEDVPLGTYDVKGAERTFSNHYADIVSELSPRIKKSRHAVVLVTLGSSHGYAAYLFIRMLKDMGIPFSVVAQAPIRTVCGKKRCECFEISLERIRMEAPVVDVLYHDELVDYSVWGRVTEAMRIADNALAEIALKRLAESS